MAYYYSEGEKDGTVVQIVKGELRKIGDWKYMENGIIADEKQFVGWYWINSYKETRYWMEDETVLALEGKKAELYENLYHLYVNDRAFFEFVMNKLKHKSVWSFEDEIKRRENVLNHTPREVKYAIYDADDYGRTIGEPRGFAIITTTGDARADEVTAIKRLLARFEDKPEDEVMGVGWYNALPWNKYEKARDARLKELRDQLDAAERAANWDPA